MLVSNKPIERVYLGSGAVELDVELAGRGDCRGDRAGGERHGVGLHLAPELPETVAP